MKKEVRAIAFVAAIIACATGSAVACGVEGRAERTDGSKVNGTETVSTNWNSAKGYPSDGWYSIDLGSSACGERVTVYVGGNEVREVRLPSSGNARVDITLRGSSSTPVR